MWYIGLMCRVLVVSRSGYYAWRRKLPSARSVENEHLKEEIRREYVRGRSEYGSPTITSALRQVGYCVNHKRIARLMRHMGLRSKVARRFKRTTKACGEREAAPNMLKQKFQTDGPNRVWLSDITYIWTAEGWLYLTMILDMWSRRLIGYAMTTHLRAEGVVEALRMATRRIPQGRAGVIFHSDRGTQYIDSNVQNILIDHQIEQSMSGTGNCYDNAMAESFFATLKKGHVFWHRYRTREEARSSIFEYVEVFYNRVRRHSALGYKSPVAFEEQHRMAYLHVHKTG